jgi:hypothetical protein
MNCIQHIEEKFPINWFALLDEIRKVFLGKIIIFDLHKQIFDWEFLELGNFYVLNVLLKQDWFLILKDLFEKVFVDVFNGWHIVKYYGPNVKINEDFYERESYSNTSLFYLGTYSLVHSQKLWAMNFDFGVFSSDVALWFFRIANWLYSDLWLFYWLGLW